jgi:hypothetical protein
MKGCVGLLGPRPHVIFFPTKEEKIQDLLILPATELLTLPVHKGMGQANQQLLQTFPVRQLSFGVNATRAIVVKAAMVHMRSAIKGMTRQPIV